MSIKITIPNSSSDVLTFGSGNTPTAAQIAGIDSGSSNGQLALYTTASGTSTERVRVDASGNVGIGTSSPSYKLHVVKGANDNAIVIDNGGGAGDNTSPYLSFAGTNGGSNYVRGRIRGAYASATAGGLVFETGDSGSMSERARITSSGQVFVNTTSSLNGTLENFQLYPVTSGSSQYGMMIGGNAQSYTVYAMRFLNTYTPAVVGSITIGTTSTAYNTSSDYRLKHDIEPMTGALAKVAALKPVTYKWNADDSDGEGFIAHELAEVAPQAVVGEKDAVDEDGSPVYQGIDTSFLVATLTAAIQEQQAIITSLTDRITALENK